MAFITPVRPLLIQLTVNKYIANSIADMVVTITLIQVGLILLETAMRFFFSFTTAWLGQSVVKDMRIAVYKKDIGVKSFAV